MIFKKIQEKRQAELRKQKKEVIKKVGVALVVGSLVSSIATLFTAPKSGKEMRKDVAVKVEEGAEIVKESATKVAKKTSEVVNEAIIKGQDIKEKVLTKVNASKADLKEDAKDIKKEVNDVVDEMKDVADEAMDAVTDK